MATPSEILPFKFKESTPLIFVQVGDQNLKLAVDTGAEINLIADKLLGKLAVNLEDRKQQNFGGFGKQAQQVTIARTAGMQIGQLSMQAMRTAFVDLAHMNCFVEGLTADGIVGYEFLSQYRVAFNFKKREMYLWDGRESVEGIMASERNGQ